MNFVIIVADNSSINKIKKSTESNSFIKYKIENLFETLLKIAKQNGVVKTHCIINEQEYEINKSLSKNDFGIPLDIIKTSKSGLLHSLLTSFNYIKSEPICIVNANTIFSEGEFQEFINYSQLQHDVDGIVAISKSNNVNSPFCVAMDDNDMIMKFSDSIAGYNWTVGGIYYFSSQIFSEIENALKLKILSIGSFLQFLINKGYNLKGFSFSNTEQTETFIKAI